MLEVKSKNGQVDIYKLDGTADRLVADIGAAAHKVLLLIANKGSNLKQEVWLRYGRLVRKLVNYMETTVSRVDEIGKEQI